MMEAGKKIYFASDAHFGLAMAEDPLVSERRFVRWMDSIKPDAAALYLLGDMFDYWFEYRTVAPKGFVRFLGKVAEFTDAGIPVFMFYGNHDIWMFDYLPRECGVTIIPDSWEGSLMGHRFFMAHGDGLGDPSLSFRLMRAFFRNKVCQWLFRWIHPDVTMPFGHAWALHNRKRKLGSPLSSYLGEDKEFQVIWAKLYLQAHPDVEFFIFGHRHIVLDLPLQPSSRVIILGDWISNFSYGEFDGHDFHLRTFAD
jgi:UDP-2,3-diacylglucosamine hydrolase